MKLRSTILAVLSAAGLALASAGPAAAHQPTGPLYDATFSGPAGVVWAGQCPALVYEDDNDWLPALCRPHGSAQAGFLLDQGITSVRYATAAGQTVFEAAIGADTLKTTTYIQLGTTPENVILDPSNPFTATCPVVDGRVVAVTLRDARRNPMLPDPDGGPARPAVVTVWITRDHYIPLAIRYADDRDRTFRVEKILAFERLPDDAEHRPLLDFARVG